MLSNLTQTLKYQFMMRRMIAMPPRTYQLTQIPFRGVKNIAENRNADKDKKAF